MSRRLSFALILALAACRKDKDATDTDARESDADTDVAPIPFSAEAAAIGFKLYYRERTERVLGVFERLGVFGDASRGLVNGRADVARTGDTWEVIPGPKDNNLAGTSTLSLWYAYRALGGRPLELALIRHFQGLAWQEEVSGIAGMTAREALAGWTRHVAEGAETTTREGLPLSRPAPEVDITAEFLATFYPDGAWTYREDPADTFFSHMPVADLEDYAVTMSFPEEGLLRVSDCCSSFVRVPDGLPWEGAWWGNHNSRDNLPDLVLGHLAALAASRAEGVPDDVRRAAEAAVAAGERVAKLAIDNGHVVMTVDESLDFDNPVPSGVIRPHGLSEGGDLGTLEACPQVFLVHTIADGGLTYPPPDLPMSPGIDELLSGTVPGVSCTVETPRTCSGLGDAYCGLTWSTFDTLQIGGRPIFDVAEGLETAVPGSAEKLLGAFQNDYDDVVEAMVGVLLGARVRGDAAQAADARVQVKAMTDTMRRFADVIWDDADPDRLEQRYNAAVFDAIAGVEVDAADIGSFAPEEARIAAVEAVLTLGDTSPWALIDDATIKARVEAALVDLGDHPSGRSDVIRDRYEAAYGDTPPIRRADDAYEARTAVSEWVPVPNPHHVRVPGMELWGALPICDSRPDLLDCSWAARGCTAADLDRDGKSDAADLAVFDAGFEDGKACADGCGGLDADGSGTLDATDRLFLLAADGCWYE